MRKMLKLALVPVLLLLGAAAVYGGGQSWFDMEHCEMCKPLAEEPGLLEHVVWEQHNISNGIVSVTTVEKDYLDAYRNAHAKMGHVVERLQKGEKVGMCGMCTALGAAMMKGAKQEVVETTYGDVMILTSDKPDVVAELQEWAKRNREEMKKM